MAAPICSTVCGPCFLYCGAFIGPISGGLIERELDVDDGTVVPDGNTILVTMSDSVGATG